MDVTLLTLPNGHMVMGKIKEEGELWLVLEHPINIVIANPMSMQTAVYTSRYNPLARDSIVSFFKNNIVSISGVDENLISHYERMVDYYKTKDFKYTAGEDDQPDQEIVDDALEQREKIRFLN
jgi:hypothetical protein